MKRTLVGVVALGGAAILAMPARARAQDAVITGRVTAEGSGAPISGATIAITDLGLGVLTNESGTYTLTVPAARVRGQTAPVIARFIGYLPLRRTITVTAGRQTQDFSIRQDVNRLNEVVITGVSAATERVKVPFAVTRIDSTQTPVPGVNPLAQLQGKVPGANIVIASGRPGAAPSVLLRGPKSINAAGRSQDPLYIVDGVILAGGLPDVNSQDIESVEVVKGAAAASLYGSQAANGVIQITTKQGRSQRDGVRFGFRTEYGVSDVEREIAIAQRHALLMDETQTRFCVFGSDCQRTVDFVEESVRINDNNQDFAFAPPPLPIDLGAGLNAQNARRLYQANPWPGDNYNAVQQFVQPKPLTIANADMNGKFGGTNFFASVNRTDQGGAVRFLNGYTRNSARVNVNQLLGSQLTVGLNTYFSRAEEDGFNQENGNGNAFFRLTRTPPVVDLTRTDSQGRLLVRTNIQGGGSQNENAVYELQNVRRLDVTNRFLGALTAKYTPLSWLNADATFGYDNADQNGRQFRNRGYRTTVNNPAVNNGLIFNYAEDQRSLNGATGITVPNATPMVKDLVVSPNVRFQYLQRDYADRVTQGTGLAVTDVEDLRNVAQSTLSSSAERRSERQLTYSGGVRFEYREPYVLDVNIRRDGNSAFGAEERWATYGRIAGTYVVSSEPFWEPISDKISLLKLIANYGTSGLAPRFNAQYETYTIGSGGTLTPLTLGNPNLKPQVDKGSELGVELGVLDAVNLTATYAQSNTENQILPVPLAAVQGFQQQWQNVGTLRNRTLELSLSFPFYRNNGLDWTGRLNYERTRTVVTRLDVLPFGTGSDATNTGNMFRIAEGEQLGAMYGRRFVTTCGELPEPFRAQCGGPGSAYQRNSDGLIVWTGGAAVGDGYTNNLWNTSLPAASAPYGGALAWGHPITQLDPSGSASYLPLGQALPKYRPSFSTNLSFRSFSAYGLLDGAIGQSVYNQGRHWAYLDFLSRDQDQANKSVADAKPASYYYRASPSAGGTGVGGLYDVLGPNNFFVEDASYVKLREVNVSYRFGQLVGVGNWTVGLTGRNLLTFTDYKGFDPEVGLTGTSAGSLGSSALTAVDAFTFPNLRTFSVTVSSSF